MKQISNRYTLTAALLALLFLWACEKEGDTIYLSGHGSNQLTVSDSEIVLTQERANQVVLSMTWTTSTLAVSDASMSAPKAEALYIQIARQEDFSGEILENKEVNRSKAYTGAELNTIAKNFRITPGSSESLYIRLRSSLGENMESKYSNVAGIRVTPYEIDMHTGFVLNADQTESGMSLYSPLANGVYSGFMGAAGWSNFWLREGDGVTWGNLPIDGNAFRLGSSADELAPWNAWFPEPSGCYFVEVNTQSREWSALYIAALRVEGDLQQDMSFDRSTGQWKAVFKATAASNVSIRLSGEGKRYDYATGTDNDKAVAQAVAFAGTAERLSFGNTAGELSVTIPEAGEYTLSVNLKDPKHWTLSLQSGSEEPDPVYPTLYLIGVDDALTGGSWAFNQFISLYDEDNRNYAGIIQVNSQWGYQMSIGIDNWADIYTLAEGDAYAGTLAFQGTGNIPAPSPGLYMVEASLKALSYQVSPIGDQIWVMGIDEKYDFNTALSATGTTGVYSGPITVSANSPWGIEIQLDQNWTYKLGGSEGKLYYKGENIQDEKLQTPGTYTMTVDLLNMTYAIE